MCRLLAKARAIRIALILNHIALIPCQSAQMATSFLAKLAHIGCTHAIVQPPHHRLHQGEVLVVVVVQAADIPVVVVLRHLAVCQA